MSERAFWWQLPGPSSFLRRIVSESREGCSLVLEWPEYGPDGWLKGLHAHDKNWHCDRVRLQFSGDDFNGSDPEVFLYERIFNKDIELLKINAQGLVELESFLGQVIILEGMDEETWDKWRPFLESYAGAACRVEAWQRTQFIVSLTGKACLKPLKKKHTLLKAHRWDGYTTPLDMQMYAAYLIRDRPLLSNLERKLMYALLARLSSWDPKLLEALCEFSVSELCQPEAHLDAFAARRDWGQGAFEATNNRGEAWALGMSQKFDDEEVWHGCLSGEKPSEHSVTYRLWHAQTEVLLPIVERERHRLVDRLRGKLVVPFATRGGIVEDERDLELSHIFTQMSQSRDQFRDVDYQRVRMLRDVRNELAHFEPVSSDLLSRLIPRRGA